jgi:hypothetical protein
MRRVIFWWWPAGQLADVSGIGPDQAVGSYPRQLVAVVAYVTLVRRLANPNVSSRSERVMMALNVSSMPPMQRGTPATRAGILGLMEPPAHRLSARYDSGTPLLRMRKEI